MPPRFVEIVDVGAEASSTIAALLHSGQNALSSLNFDFSRYINENTTDALVAALQHYNLTLDAIPKDWNLNFSVPNEDAPEGRSKNYLLIGLAVVLARELIVTWRVSCLLSRHSLYKK